ncbi:MAG: RnfABCDGE type electron transport complex subunit G [Candidatus Marinimicrobia bacterium]|nr:RnfABCDGE type electron transport complex subunit G [Candidatus Neomarinimicrobiota bacterium]MBL7022860.1 RnfABCDGE type electron transport complex subunit G [Candidatus Neomarinimicrobiota bacterium]MBL7110040.1 RnfABCDGE type electron transport complex subunit G [Candidatus Neomarinimicrobiota bacterium]
MKTSAKMIIVLTVIATLSGGILSFWNGITAPKIKENRLKVLKKAISTVLPKYDNYEELKLSEEITLYIGKTLKEETVGFAFKAKGNGFSPDLTLMVGILPDFSALTGIEILEQTETPGLGNKIEDDEFREQFVGLLMGIEPNIAVVKNRKPKNPQKGIQALSGATISSKAVVFIIIEQVKIVQNLYNQKMAGI